MTSYNQIKQTSKIYIKYLDKVRYMQCRVFKIGVNAAENSEEE